MVRTKISIRRKLTPSLLKNKKMLYAVFQKGWKHEIFYLDIDEKGTLSFNSFLVFDDRKGFQKITASTKGKYKKMSSDDWYKFIESEKQRCLKNKLKITLEFWG